MWKTVFQEFIIQNNIKMADNLLSFFVCIAWGIMGLLQLMCYDQLQGNIPKQTMPIWFTCEKTLKVFVFAKNNRFGEACNYNNEPFKPAVTVKEIINLKYDMIKVSHKNKDSLL